MTDRRANTRNTKAKAAEGNAGNAEKKKKQNKLSKQRPVQEESEDLVDIASEDTFPASDAPPTSPMTSLGRHSPKKKRESERDNNA